MTNDPMLARVALAEYINKRSGGVVLKPWEMDDLPDEWLWVYEALRTNDGPATRKHENEARLERMRQANPTYRKYL